MNLKQQISTIIRNTPPLLLVSILILVQLAIYNYLYMIQLPPASIHAWRQSDCLSFALNFYNGRASFLEPCVNNLSVSGDGKAASDFPIVQFLVAQIWKVTGVHTSAFRIVNVIFLVIGLLFLFKTSYKITNGNKPVSILVTLLANTSPILAYYGATTISDIHAFSMSWVGIYYFVKWNDTLTHKDFIKFSIFYLLAGLLKPSAAFSYIICLAFAGLKFLMRAEWRKKLNKIYVNVLFILIPFTGWYLWFSYANHYNRSSGNGFFLTGLLPIWKIPTKTETLEIGRQFLHHLINEMYHPFLLLLVIFAGLSIIIQYLRKHFLYAGLIALCFLVFTAYILLFFEVFKNHDYYLINMNTLAIITILLVLKIIQLQKPLLLSNQYTLTAIFLLVLLFTFTTSTKTWSHFTYKADSLSNVFLFDNEESKLKEWYQWDENKTFESFRDKHFKLENYGIQSADTIMVLGDESWNRTLYLTQRLGYTSLNTEKENLPDYINDLKDKGLKYLLVIREEYLAIEGLKQFYKYKIGEFKNIHIYKL